VANNQVAERVQAKFEDGTLILSVQAEELTGDDLRVCSEAVQQAMTQCTVFVLDLGLVTGVKPDAIPLLINLALDLERSGFRLMILLKEKLADVLQDPGDNLAPCYVMVSGSVSTAKDAKGTPNKSEVAQAMIDGLSKTIKSYTQVELKPQSGESPVPVEIGAVAHLSLGQGKECAVMIGFPKSTFLALVKRIKGVGGEMTAEEVQDWASEFLNVALGYAKASLNNRGFGVTFDIPKLVTASDYPEARKALGTPKGVRIAGEVGDVQVEISDEGESS